MKKMMCLIIVFCCALYSEIVFAQSLLTMAVIGSDPVDKIKKQQPFIDYVAEKMSDVGIEKGKIIFVEDIYQIADLFQSGKADIFIDSPFPSVMLNELVDTQFLLRRWKKGVAEYHSVIFVKAESGISTLNDLKGKMISFENSSSTSGYFLPKTLLLNNRLKLREKKHLTSRVSPKEVGYIFSEGDETTMVWVLRDKVHAGAIDYPNFIEDSKGKEKQLKILHATDPIPRHVVSCRKGLSAGVVNALKKVLLNMDQTKEGKEILTGYGKTKKFDLLPPQSIKVLQNMKQYVKLELNE